MPNLIHQRGDEILRRLPSSGDVRGVEVGVWDGRLSEYLLGCCDRLTLWMVDRWAAVPETHQYYRSESQMARAPQTTFDEVKNKAVTKTDQFGARANICQGESEYWAGILAGETFDFVFVDADHSYEGVRDDITRWAPMVSDGGWLCGHDWKHPDHVEEWGVSQAVEEYVGREGGQIELGNNRTWFVQMARAGVVS